MRKCNFYFYSKLEFILGIMEYIESYQMIKASGRLNNACVIIMRTHAAVHRLASDRRAPRVLAGGAQTSGAKAQVVPLSSGQHALRLHAHRPWDRCRNLGRWGWGWGLGGKGSATCTQLLTSSIVKPLATLAHFFFFFVHSFRRSICLLFKNQS